MKKVLIVLVVVLIVVGVAYAIMTNVSTEENAKNEVTNTNEVENEIEEEKEGYDVLVSKKELTIEKRKEETFEITFTNPDLTSIREYIHSDEQSDIILVKYTDLVDDKITVYVEGLKEGTAEILVCDYNYPEVNEIIKVTVK